MVQYLHFRILEFPLILQPTKTTRGPFEKPAQCEAPIFCRVSSSKTWSSEWWICGSRTTLWKGMRHPPKMDGIYIIYYIYILFDIWYIIYDSFMWKLEMTSPSAVDWAMNLTRIPTSADVQIESHDLRSAPCVHFWRVERFWKDLVSSNLLPNRRIFLTCPGTDWTS